MKKYWMVLICWMISAGCKPHDHSDSGSYEAIVAESWMSFTQGDYQAALASFNEAKKKNPDASEPYAGKAWTYMRLNLLGSAYSEFSAGSTKTDPSADLFAGWGFVLNAQKDYSASNEKIATALDSDPNWIFSYGLGLNAQDLHVTRAENYFLLGDYSHSLQEVKMLDSNFEVDILTNSGQAALAAEIETLKTVWS